MQSSIYVELAPGASVEDLRQHLKVFYEVCKLRSTIIPDQSYLSDVSLNRSILECTTVVFDKSIDIHD